MKYPIEEYAETSCQSDNKENHPLIYLCDTTASLDHISLLVNILHNNKHKLINT